MQQMQTELFQAQSENGMLKKIRLLKTNMMNLIKNLNLANMEVICIWMCIMIVQILL